MKEMPAAVAMLLGFAIGWFVAGMLFGVLGKVWTDDAWRSQIEQHGCAEYYLDEKRERQWRWKPCGGLR